MFPSDFYLIEKPCNFEYLQSIKDCHIYVAVAECPFCFERNVFWRSTFKGVGALCTSCRASLFPPFARKVFRCKRPVQQELF